MPRPRDKKKNQLSNSHKTVLVVPRTPAEPDSPASTLHALHEQIYMFLRTAWYFIPPIMLITAVFIISFLYYYQNFDMTGLVAVPVLLSSRRERLFPIRQRASEAIAHCPIPPREIEVLLALRMQSPATRSITTAATSHSSNSESRQNKAISKKVSKIWSQTLIDVTKQLDEFYSIAKGIKGLELLEKIVRKNIKTLFNDIKSSRYESSPKNLDKMTQELDELSKFILVFKPIIHELKELQDIANTVRSPTSDEGLMLKFLAEYTRLSNQNYPLRVSETSVAGATNIVDVLKKVKWRLINNIIQNEKMILLYIDHIDDASISRQLFNGLIRYNDHFYKIIFDEGRLSADKLSHILNDHLLSEKIEKKYFVDFFKKILFYQYKNKTYHKNFEIAYHFMDAYYMQIPEGEREAYLDFFKKDLHSWSSWEIIKKKIESFFKINETFNDLLNQMIIDNIPSHEVSNSGITHYKFSDEQAEQFIIHIILQLAEMSLDEFKNHPLILGYLQCPHLWGALNDFLGAVTITELELGSRAPKPISKNIAMAKLAVIIASQIEKDINNFSDERIHAIFDKGLRLGPTTKIVVFLEHEPEPGRYLRFILNLRRIFNAMAKLSYKDHWQVESFASISYHAIKAVHRKLSFIEFKQLIQRAYQSPEVAKGMSVDQWLIQRIEEINTEQAENEIFTKFNAKIAAGGLLLGSLCYLLLKMMSTRAVPVRAAIEETPRVVVSAKLQSNVPPNNPNSDSSNARVGKRRSKGKRFQAASSSVPAESLDNAQISSSSNVSKQVKYECTWQYLRENFQRYEIELDGEIINISLDTILVFARQDFLKNKQSMLDRVLKLVEFERIKKEATQLIEKLLALGRMDSKQLQETNEALMAPQALIDLCKFISNLHAQNVHDNVQRQLKYLFELINQFHAQRIQSDGENEFDNVASSNNGNQGEGKLTSAAGHSTVVACSSASSTDPLNGEDGSCRASCSQGVGMTEEQARATMITIGKNIIELLKHEEMQNASIKEQLNRHIDQLAKHLKDYWPDQSTYIELGTFLSNNYKEYENWKSKVSSLKNSLSDVAMQTLNQFIKNIKDFSALPPHSLFWFPTKSRSKTSSEAMASPNPWR